MNQEFLKGTEPRKHKLFTLKNQAEKQIQFFQKFTKQSEITTLASYQLAWNMHRLKNHMMKGISLKNASVTLLMSYPLKMAKPKRMISDLQLSGHTVECRVSEISTVIELQLHSDLQACEYFSVTLDESCDVEDKPQLSIFA